MPTILFIDCDGVTRAAEGEAGQSLMEVARFNDIPGIEAQCGGMCACATCHVYVEDEFLPKVGGPTECEEPLLEFVEDLRRNSRLACQIELTDALDGLRVHTPVSQG